MPHSSLLLAGRRRDSVCWCIYDWICHPRKIREGPMGRKLSQATRIWWRIYRGIFGSVDGGEGTCGQRKVEVPMPPGGRGWRPWFCPSHRASPPVSMCAIYGHRKQLLANAGNDLPVGSRYVVGLNHPTEPSFRLSALSSSMSRRRPQFWGRCQKVAASLQVDRGRGRFTFDNAISPTYFRRRAVG